MNKLLFIFALSMPLIVHSERAADENLDGLFDKNSDGIVDVYYEYNDDGSYFEFVDSNYDGKVDERCTYNSNDTLVNCSYDQNFDGHPETKVKYNLGLPIIEGVDTNQNNLFDIVFKFKSGVLYEGFKYSHDKDGTRLIGSVNFEYGYPLSENLTETLLSEKEFSESNWGKFND